MAGETTVQYRVSETPRRDSPVATGWLLALWTAALAASGLGASIAVFVERYPTWVAIATFVYAIAIGGPLFLVTWFWLAATEGFRHRPFVVLLLCWLGVSGVLPNLGPFDPSDRGIGLAFALLPVVSSAVLLRIVAHARARERECFETSVRAT